MVPSIAEAQSIGPAGADKRVAIAKGGARSVIRFGSKAHMCGAQADVRGGLPMTVRNDHHPNIELGQLTLFGAAGIVLLVLAWTFAFTVPY